MFTTLLQARRELGMPLTLALTLALAVLAAVVLVLWGEDAGATTQGPAALTAAPGHAG